MFKFLHMETISDTAIRSIVFYVSHENEKNIFDIIEADNIKDMTYLLKKYHPEIQAFVKGGTIVTPLTKFKKFSLKKLIQVSYQVALLGD